MARRSVRALWGYVRLFKQRTLKACRAWFVGAAVLGLCGCVPPQSFGVEETIVSHSKPQRIVSLDFCADQFVLKLADRDNIVGLSPDATRDFSYLADQAAGLPQVRPTGEEILALRPDLIVRSYGGDPKAVAFFERAGIKVHQIGWGDDFEAVRRNVQQAADALGQSARGTAVVAEFDQRLANLKPANKVSTLYVTAGGITTGSGSMIDLMMTTAGLTNFQSQRGWGALPLERLAHERPQLIAAAFFNDGALTREYWSSARHPLIANALADLPIAQLRGATTACGGWFVMDGVEALAKAGRLAQEHAALRQGHQP
jgi:iron complex transport system substrate-binding protein